MDTGFLHTDVQADFSRARRRRVLGRLARRLRGQPNDFNVILPFEEVVAALGEVGRRDAGFQSIPLDAIVGTVERSGNFDRGFNPTTAHTRPRWERIARAERLGERMPPISVFAIGDLYFVRDGHHRVSVARARGATQIDAYVTEVRTRLGADPHISVSDLPLKQHERVFLERVPLSPEARRRVRVSDPWDYAKLAEGVEAWSFRAAQDHGRLVSREETAEAWYREDYLPVVEALHEADMIGRGTETDAYMRVVTERYRLLRTHEWSDQVLDRLRPEL
jgi:hypothetical protein